MTAKTASAYVDEVSVQAFRRACGKIYPLPIKIAGKGQRWIKSDLDKAIDRLIASPEKVSDAADVL
jgi:hypothetical protein